MRSRIVHVAHYLYPVHGQIITTNKWGRQTVQTMKKKASLSIFARSFLLTMQHGGGSLATHHAIWGWEPQATDISKEKEYTYIHILRERRQHKQEQLVQYYCGRLNHAVTGGAWATLLWLKEEAECAPTCMFMQKIKTWNLAAKILTKTAWIQAPSYNEHINMTASFE